MTPIPAYLLAGGTSRRFGSDKARARVGERALLEVAADQLGGCRAVGSITVVAETAGSYSDLGLRTIADVAPGKGPLGGLQAALGDLSSDAAWLLLASCDLLGVPCEWIERLFAARQPGDDAVAFRGPERWQTLPALYHRRLGPLVDQLLDRDRLALFRVLDGARSVPLPRSWSSLVTDVNTPADLARRST